MEFLKGFLQVLNNPHLGKFIGVVFVGSVFFGLFFVLILFIDLFKFWARGKFENDKTFIENIALYFYDAWGGAGPDCIGARLAAALSSETLAL